MCATGAARRAHVANVIKESWVEHIEEYRLVFNIHGPGWGYSFPCDKEGK